MNNIYENMTTEDFKKLIEKKDFNINEVVVNFEFIYRYVTPFIYIFLTEDFELINKVLDNYMGKINPKIIVKPEIKNTKDLEYDLLSVLYSSLYCRHQTYNLMLPLIYHFESLDFLKEENTISKKISIVNFIIKQSDIYKCSTKFKKELKNKLDQLYKEQEAFIVGKISLMIKQISNEIDNLNNPTSKLLQIKDRLKNIL